ncbi:MAG TPA: class I SAM-dependent methyltransferase [Candidatus Acidoferrales bacterium]|nr:class I SAM-dependent methyltransferase [Candidatus Acidoferrales bacterium]
MAPELVTRPRISHAVLQYWKVWAEQEGVLAAGWALTKAFWEFLLDSTPARLRQRFGDADYDWDYRVNTTSGAVGWRERLLGVFYSAYQPTDPASFHEMLEALLQSAHVDLADFTFLDLGSGKGRTLLMASDYPFRRIVGVELLPALNEIARQNLAVYKSDTQKCFAVESVCADATSFPIPEGPILVYLFNPFPAAALRKALANIAGRFGVRPKPTYVLYYNPEHEKILLETPGIRRIAGARQYSIFEITN